MAKVAAILLLCLAAGTTAHPLRSLLQAPTGATTAAPGTINVPAAVVAAPTSESLLRTFELAATPSAEAQQDSNMLMGVLSNPQQFVQQVNQIVSRPNGVTMLAAAFSDLIAAGMSQQLANAIGQGFGQAAAPGAAGAAPVSAQAGGSAMNQVNTAFALAVIDQIGRRDIMNAAQAVWWSTAGAGGSDLARAVAAELASFEVRAGCSAPLSPVLQELGSLAQAQAQMGAGAPGAGGLQANVQTFASNVEQQAQLWACFQSAYPNYSALTQQGAGAGTMG